MLHVPGTRASHGCTVRTAYVAPQAPAGSDLPMWSDSGDFGAALKASAQGGECAWSAYPDMSHGWSCRGDLSDEKVRRDVEA